MVCLIICAITCSSLQILTCSASQLFLSHPGLPPFLYFLALLFLPWSNLMKSYHFFPDVGKVLITSSLDISAYSVQSSGRYKAQLYYPPTTSQWLLALLWLGIHLKYRDVSWFVSTILLKSQPFFRSALVWKTRYFWSLCICSCGKWDG